MFLMCSSKKGISANQLHRTLGVTLKSARFLVHRIREAMKDTDDTPMGGNGKPVEVDETYIGPTTYTIKKDMEGKDRVVPDRGMAGKLKVLTLVERTAENIGDVLARHVRPDSRIMTDEAR
jgi:hypothetical protein